MGWRYAISAPVGLPGDAARNRDSRHAVERHSGGLSSRLNWPRAAVLGANDGIVSVAGIVLGVAGPPRREAPYSPLGRRAWWPARCRWRSANMCRCRVSETARSRCSPGNGESCGRCRRGVGRTGGDIRGQGRLSADGRTSRRRIAAWPRRFSRPLQAAAASAASFTVGSLLPLLAIWLPPAMFRLPVTFVAVLITLRLAGALSARVRREPRRPRRVAGGDRRPGRVSPTRTGSPLFAAGVNRRRDPRSQF